MTRILFVEAVQYGTYYDDRYNHIRNLGYDVCVLYGIGEIGSRDPDCHRVADTRSVATIAEVAAKWHAESPFGGVATLAEPSVLAAAEVAARLGLTYPSREAALASRDKFVMRQRHRQGAVAHPDFIGLHKLADLEAWPEKAFPAIVKPAMGSASSFVFRADTPDELRRAAATVLSNARTMAVSNLEADMPARDAPTVVVESFLEGSEHLVEGFAYEGVFTLGALVDRITLEGNTFDDDVHHSPSRLDMAAQDAIRELVQAAVHAQGIVTAPIHAEVRHHGNKPYIVELAIRPGGGGLNRMAEICWSYDPLDMVARLALGEAPDWQPSGPTGTHTAAACLIGPEGRIQRIDGSDALVADAQVFFFKLVASEGTLLLRPPRGNSIVGFLGVTGDSYDAATAALHEKSALLQVSVEEIQDAA